jgi:hypothetical protein
MDDDREALLDEIEGHGFPHEPKADKADCVRHAV